MPAIIELLSPPELGEERIRITLDPGSSLNSLQPITVNFDYALADPQGIALPLELTVQPATDAGGDGTGYLQRFFYETIPRSFTFRTPGTGQHLIVLREYFHNRWFGRLLIEVTGDPFAQVIRRRA